jgi:hypothetical protein
VSANIFEKIGYVGGGKILLGSVGLAKNTDISLALIRKLIYKTLHIKLKIE